MKVKAKPFLKWASGKNQLLSQFENYYPTQLKDGKIKKYIEPFLGGGAVFFEISQRYSWISRAAQSIFLKNILNYQQEPRTLEINFSEIRDSRIMIFHNIRLF